MNEEEILNNCKERFAGKHQKYCDECGQALDWSELIGDAND